MTETAGSIRGSSGVTVKSIPRRTKMCAFMRMDTGGRDTRRCQDRGRLKEKMASEKIEVADGAQVCLKQV